MNNNDNNTNNNQSPSQDQYTNNNQYIDNNQLTNNETQRINDPIINSNVNLPDESLQVKTNPPIYNFEENTTNVKKDEKKVKKNKNYITTKKAITSIIAVALVVVLVNSTFLYYLMTNIFPEQYASKDDLKANSISTTKILNTSTNIEDDDKVSTDVTGKVLDVSAIVEEVMPSIVAITSTSIVNSNYNPFSSGGSYQVTGAGSGIIIGKNDTELLIVTNNHVVDGTTELTVSFINEIEANAYIKGTNSSTDLAVVAIKLSELDSDTIDAIKIASLGESDTLKVGEGVIAIGNALGYGQSVTVGVVSALDRNVTIGNMSIDMIQTDAAINGGNSGGALINLNGEVVGINAAKSSSGGTTSASVEGMGYAIPISNAKDIITDLMNKETKEKVDEKNKGYIGITGNTIDQSTSEYYGIPMGVYVQSVAKDGPADKAGIKKRDVIVEVEGNLIESFDDLSSELDYYEAGETISLKIKTIVDGEYVEKEVEITLTKKESIE